MTQKRDLAAQQRDLNKLLEFLREHPNESFEEVQLKAATGVGKQFIRGLLRGHEDIDAAELDAGRIRYIPPS